MANETHWPWLRNGWPWSSTRLVQPPVLQSSALVGLAGRGGAVARGPDDGEVTSGGEAMGAELRAGESPTRGDDDPTLVSSVRLGGAEFAGVVVVTGRRADTRG